MDVSDETTRGGVLGKIAGRAKAAVGGLTDNDDLAREGRLQEAQADAEVRARREEAEARQPEPGAKLEEERVETQAERDRLAAEVDAQKREEAAERDRARAEQQAAAD